MTGQFFDYQLINQLIIICMLFLFVHIIVSRLEIENIEIYIFTYLYVQNRLNSICKNNYETKDLISNYVLQVVTNLDSTPLCI